MTERLGLDASVVVDGILDAGVTAPPASVVAVIGPNGAGKTTLLGALAGIVHASGHVHVDGEDWTTLPVRERNVGLVFQDQSLFPHLSALRNVAFGPRARGVRRDEAEALAADWLRRFGIDDLAGRRPAQLSGGQAQRVAIARALATEPSLLLLDEPFAGLDVGVSTSLRLELSRHLAAYEGVTVLVTHDALDALTLADLIVVIDDGRVAQFGTPEQVAAEPRTDHVARLVGLNIIRSGERFGAFGPSAVVVSVREPDGSARHRWRGEVVSVIPHGDALRLRVATDPELIADVTPAAAAELRLAPGTPVWLSVKETSMSWYDALPEHVTGR